MRVVLWPASDDASAWYRLKFPAGVLAAQGHDVVVDRVGPQVAWDTNWSHLSEPPYEAHVMGLQTAPDADVTVINRPARAHWAEVIPHLQAAGVKVICDVDDDFAAVPIDNSARKPYSLPRFSGKWVERACLLADLVTVSTPDLARRYAPHGRVVVLPNLVPASYLNIEAERLPNTIGWSGNVDTHPGDLEATGGAVRDVLGEHGDWSVHVIGTGRGVAKRLSVNAAQATSTGDWLPFHVYPQALARLAVGIVPLQPSRFNRSKSRLKAAELSSLGVPVVMSPTPDNKRLHDLGVGLLASNPREWRQQLTRLVEDDDLRAHYAHAGRQAMAGQTYEQHADRWLDAWSRALRKQAVA